MYPTGLLTRLQTPGLPTPPHPRVGVGSRELDGLREDLLLPVDRPPGEGEVVVTVPVGFLRPESTPSPKDDEAVPVEPYVVGDSEVRVPVDNPDRGTPVFPRTRPTRDFEVHGTGATRSGVEGGPRVGGSVRRPPPPPQTPRDGEEGTSAYRMEPSGTRRRATGPVSRPRKSAVPGCVRGPARPRTAGGRGPPSTPGRRPSGRGERHRDKPGTGGVGERHPSSPGTPTGGRDRRRGALACPRPTPPGSHAGPHGPDALGGASRPSSTHYPRVDPRGHSGAATPLAGSPRPTGVRDDGRAPGGATTGPPSPTTASGVPVGRARGTVGPPERPSPPRRQGRRRSRNTSPRTAPGP